MTLSFLRVLFILVSSSIGYYFGGIIEAPLEGTLIACCSALALILAERLTQRVSLQGLSSMVFGIILGVLMAKLLSSILLLVPLEAYTRAVMDTIFVLVFSYIGSVLALRGKDEFNVIIPYVRFRRQDVSEQVVLLDTSAIIDGRIVDIYKTNFLNARIVVPKFVVQELQALADSHDETKHQKGRRGLDILKSMQNDTLVDLHFHEVEKLPTESVDERLIKLGKLMDAKICTTDFNLGQTATLLGIGVLNVNELLKALKSVFFPGDKIYIKLIKAGKEPNQAIAYTDDGTMIVVKNAKSKIGHIVEVIVTSVIQTQAGKMIFAELEGN